MTSKITRFLFLIWGLSFFAIMAALFYFVDLLPEVVPSRFDWSGSPVGHMNRRSLVILMSSIAVAINGFHLCLARLIKVNAGFVAAAMAVASSFVNFVLLLCLHLICQEAGVPVAFYIPVNWAVLLIIVGALTLVVGLSVSAKRKIANGTAIRS